MAERQIITIDGETAAGKGTLAKRLARNNRLYYLGAGQIFRAIGHMGLSFTLSPSEAAQQFTEGEATYRWDGDRAVIKVGGTDITPKLDDDDVATQASKLAKSPENLHVVNSLIRTIGLSALQYQGIVCEGRNTATAIFPETDVPFYVTAQVAVRARRRYLDHLREGREISFDEVLSAMIERDQRDKTRSAHPLGPTPESIIIDTTVLTIPEAEHRMQQYIRAEDTL